jgi:hypothetical protein
MKGYYLRFRFNDVPELTELIEYLGWDAQFYACHHEDFRGGVMVEVVSTRPGPYDTNIETYAIHVMEFFCDAIIEAGGVCVDHGRIVYHEPHSDVWRQEYGFLAFALNDVDLSHPRALHAFEYAKIC